MSFFNNAPEEDEKLKAQKKQKVQHDTNPEQDEIVEIKEKPRKKAC